MNMNVQPPLERADVLETPMSAPEQSRRRRGAAAAALALGVAAAGYGLLHRPAAAPPPPPPAVTIAQPLVGAVNEWDDYVGRFAPSRTVEVRPRVSGQVTAVLFRDGDFVRAGQPLFRLDPRPFAAALDEARANAASARSALALARLDYGRAARLTGDEAVSASEIDTLRAKVQADTAALAAADARVRARALDLEFAQVRAPIAGRVSDRRADPGNLVSAGDGAAATLLTTINAVDPIYFAFDASEALFLKTEREKRANPAGAPIEVRLQDETDYRWKGRVDFTDNALDQRSGTIRGRAIIANPNGFLTPGMFGNMRLTNGAPVRALMVPDSAVQSDQARKTLLVVGADGIVAARPVELGPIVGDLRVIRSGIAPGDRVVIDGTQMAAPGNKVTVRRGRIAAAPAASATTPVIPVAAQATFAR